MFYQFNLKILTILIVTTIGLYFFYESFNGLNSNLSETSSSPLRLSENSISGSQSQPKTDSQSQSRSPSQTQQAQLHPHHHHYQLYDPDMAPDDIKPLVTKGFQIMLETKKLLPEYTGDRLSCTHCHFAGGNTFGGKQNGISLVGVNHLYPRQLDSGKELTLAERINGCFLRSLNGKELPLDSEEMKAMLAYLEWISQDIPKLPRYSWLGLKELRSSHKPDPMNGAKVFKANCAMCHGENGEGQERPLGLSYPPLWGEHSFNDAAGMTRISMLAPFIYENMPYNEPRLTIEDALDVAAFVIEQPRPHFGN